MSFRVLEMPSGGVLITGKLVQKKLTAKSRRTVILCFPKTVEDVEMAAGEIGTVSAEVYGHLSLSAISGFPLLVVGTSARTFIHFSQIQGLYDEEDLKQACSFSLLTSQSEFRFYSETSTNYQKWVGALTQAFESMSQSQETYRPASPGSQISRPMSAMSKDPEDYIDAHRALSVNREESRRRRSFNIVGPSNTKMSLHDETPKQTVFQKIKAFFKKEKDGEVDEDRGRESVGVRGRESMDVRRGLRERSRSAAKFLGLGRREENSL